MAIHSRTPAQRAASHSAFEALPLQPGLEDVEQEFQEIFFGDGVRRGASLDRAFLVERSRSARAADARDDLGMLGRGVERELDVVVAAAIGGEPQPASRREDREGVAFDLQRVGDLPDERRRDLVEKRLVGALRLSRALFALLRPIACAVNRTPSTDYERAETSTVIIVVVRRASPSRPAAQCGRPPEELHGVEPI